MVEVVTDTRSKKYDCKWDGTADRSCAEHTARYGQGGDFVGVCVGMGSDFDYARPGA